MCCYLYRTKVLHPRFQPYKLHLAILGNVNTECKCKVSAEVNEVDKANSRRDDSAIFTEVSESNAFH
jgi:hypothetical protein